MEAEEKAGFRARSTIDHLFTLTQIIEKKFDISKQEIHIRYPPK